MTECPATKILKVGIDIQAMKIPFLTTQSPACGNAVTYDLTYVLSPDSDPTK